MSRVLPACEESAFLSVSPPERTMVLKNVEGLRLENVRIGGQRVDGRLEWRQAAPRP